MTNALVWISGGSSGIGAAMARTVPFDDARVISISRSKPADGIEHLEADLADPSSWPVVAEAFRKEVAGFDGHGIAFVHAAGALDPIGFVADVDSEAYAANVILNSAAPQVLGQAFVAAVAGLPSVHRHLVMLTSGAAKNVYAGWSAYGASKAATDQWVRDVGEEQKIRGGVHVIAVAPGTVNTDMQTQLRETSEDQFPNRQKFLDAHEQGKLTDPDDAARDVWGLLGRHLETGSVVDLRELAKSSN